MTFKFWKKEEEKKPEKKEKKPKIVKKHKLMHWMDSKHTYVQAVVGLEQGFPDLMAMGMAMGEAGAYKNGSVYLRNVTAETEEERCRRYNCRDLHDLGKMGEHRIPEGSIIEIMVDGTDEEAYKILLRFHSAISTIGRGPPDFIRHERPCYECRCPRCPQVYGIDKEKKR